MDSPGSSVNSRIPATSAALRPSSAPLASMPSLSMPPMTAFRISRPSFSLVPEGT